VVQLLEKARSDPRVAGVVLRVNSPGGSALASDSIYHAIQELKEAEIPVVCSMSNYAASGGYMIAVACDKIIAQPTTITGSIGVIGGKITFQRFLDRYGVKFDKVQFGKNSTAMSAFEDFNSAQMKRLDKDIDVLYKDFVEKVAKGRNMKYQEALKLAKGRVWTGRQAQECGLVDELGGLEKAVADCAANAKLDLVKDGVKVEDYPPQPTMKEVFKKLLKSRARNDDDDISVTSLLLPVMTSYMTQILGGGQSLHDIARWSLDIQKTMDIAKRQQSGYETKAPQFPEFK